MRLAEFGDEVLECVLLVGVGVAAAVVVVVVGDPGEAAVVADELVAERECVLQVRFGGEFLD